MAKPRFSELRPYDEDPPDPKFLLPQHVRMINEALCSLGEYGEVRLVVEKGRLRYLVTHKSLDVLKWEPGTLIKELGT